MRLRPTVLIMAIGAVFAIMGCGAFADDYYVATTGSDTTGDGSSGNPWQTVAYALSWIEDNDPGSAADPHTIHIAGGTYDSSIGESYPLQMQSYVSLSGEDEATTILDAGYRAYHVVYCDNVDYFRIENLKITRGGNNNTADGEGGGIRCAQGSSPTLSNCTISDNSAEYGGGGIACSNDSSPTLTDCTINGNTSISEFGGGLYCTEYSSPTLTDCWISQNTASYYGGGLYCVEYSSPTLTNCTVSGNTAEYLRGGIYCYFGSSLMLIDCTFSGNTGTNSGGGIYCNTTSSPTLTNCTLSGNTASSHGGGIYCNTTSSPTLTNCTLSGNTASIDGGGIFCYDNGSPTLTNCTLNGNTAPSGGGIYCHDASCEPTVLNSILWGDSPDEIAGDTTNVTVTYSDVQWGWTGTGNIEKDPLFVPHDEYGEHTGYYIAHEGAQAAYSPCVDAGYGSVSDYGLAGTTTCTDGREDGDDIPSSQYGPIDMGYHYPEGYTGDDDRYIELVSFEARAHRSSIVLTWETGAEIDNACFVLFRTVAGAQDYRQVSDLIAAEGTPASGTSYTFVDNGDGVEPGTTYDYWLVDIETSGDWTAHGPASARVELGLRLIELPAANRQARVASR